MIRLISFILIIAIVDLYAFQGIKTAFENSKWKQLATSIYWGFTGFSLLFFALSTAMDFRHHGNAFTKYLFGLIVSVLIFKIFLILFLLVEDFMRLGKVGYNKVADGDLDMSRSSFFNKIAVGVGGLPFVAFLYGMAKSAYDYQVNHIVVKLPNLPAGFEGLKIVQISDIHSGSFTRTEPLIKAVAQINALKPDLFFFTGDLVNDLATEIEPYIDIFKTIESKYGNFSITGNHDYSDYMKWDSATEKMANFKALVDSHQKMGWKILLNENHIIENEAGEKLAIIGIENWGVRFAQYGKLHKAIQGSEVAPVRILLSHDPSHWDAEVRKKYPEIDLALAGHTHGFQMGVETKYFRFSPVQWVYKQWAGLYKEDHQYLYVNRGFGFIGFPGRVGILPEIAVIELQRG